MEVSQINCNSCELQICRERGRHQRQGISVANSYIALFSSVDAVIMPVSR
jgi:hypothetical protein